MNVRAQAQLSSHALVHNFNVLGNKVPHAKLIPMIKANAYGHGMSWAAKALESQKQIYAFGVATFDEAVELRKTCALPILVFSDAAPWTEERHQAFLKYQLSPVLSEFQSYQNFIQICERSSNVQKLAFHLEFNTGMNRLGLEMDALSAVVSKHQFKPTSIFTHLAEAETPKSKLTQKQMKSFQHICDLARAQFPEALLHFANSAAIWNAKHYPLLKQMDLARPGLSLYGVKPFEEAKETGPKLKRVMELTAPVLNQIQLKKGDRVGYGGTYQCKNPKGERIAVIGAGYADGIFRALGNQGFAAFGKKRLHILGRVSMDLSAVSAVPNLKIGDRVEFWGENVDPYDQANAAGTNPYEIMTRVGERVERVSI